MQFDDFNDATDYDPSPWGSRQRVLPKHGFKAVASTLARLPGLPPEKSEKRVEEAPLHLDTQDLELIEFQPAVAKSAAPRMPVLPTLPPPMLFDQPLPPIVRERDIPTCRVEKLPAPAKRGWLDLRYLKRFLPIIGAASVAVIAVCSLHMSTSGASAALAPSSAPSIATIEMTATPAPIAEAPHVAPHVAVIQPAIAEPAHAQVAKHQFSAPMHHANSARPKLDMNTATPLGDLAKRRR